MRKYPLISSRTLDAVYAFCQQAGRLRSDDADEVYGLQKLSQPVRLLASNVTSVGNVGGGEDNLMVYTLPDGILTKNGHYLTVEGLFRTAANGNNKRIRAYFGSTLIFDSAASASNDKSVMLQVTVIRKAAAAQVCYAKWQSNDAAWGLSTLQSADAAETLASAGLAVKFTGEATSTDDIVQKSMTAKWFPANIEAA